MRSERLEILEKLARTMTDTALEVEIFNKHHETMFHLGRVNQQTQALADSIASTAQYPNNVIANNIKNALADMKEADTLRAMYQNEYLARHGTTYKVPASNNTQAHATTH